MITTLHRKPVASVRFSLFIAVVLFCLAALSAHAQSVTKDHIKYNITNSTRTAVVTGTDGSYLQHVVIADSVANSSGQYFPVVGINASAFKNVYTLRSVVFSANLKKIASYAFAGCEMLTEAIIPEGVETIENYAFQNCSMRYVDLPSTLRTLGNGAFKSNSSQQIDTLVVRTAYYDSAGKMSILPFSNSSFNSKVNMSKCVLMVPSKAYDDYAASTTSSGLSNWGAFFANIVAFGTAPSSCSVVPAGELKDYRDLSTVDVTFCFDDETLTDVLSLGTDDHIEASLVLPSGKSISADAVVLKGNTVSIDFARVLQQNRELFIAPSEDVTTMAVQLKIEGQLQVEECPFSLTDYFSDHPYEWTVPLLPSVYDLPAAPEVLLATESHEGSYDYTAFETVTLAFPGYTDLSLDTTTGAYINARLYKDGQLLCTSEQSQVTGDNTLAIAFEIPLDSFLVRRNTGILGYEFSLELEGQVSMKDDEDVKNFRFTLPLSGQPRPWQVRAAYIPEPTAISYLPAVESVSLESLTDIAVTFEGVSALNLSSENQVCSARLSLGGKEQSVIDARQMRIEGNTLHLLFDPIEESFITLITPDWDYTFDATVSLTADLLTDGYPCRVVIGADDATAETGEPDESAESPYTQHWPAPHWPVPAVVKELPSVTVHVPGISEGDELLTHEQLKVIELEVTNYKQVTLPTSSDEGAAASSVVAQLVRNGRSVCVVNAVKVEDNKIIIDFGDNLNFNSAGITPEDDPEAPLEFALCFEGDLLFDGLPYHFVYDGTEEELTWLVRPIVVTRLPKPTIEYANGGIYFSCGVEGVDYHYSISNADGVTGATAIGVKGTAGSSLQVPLKQTYVITVFGTREGYEDSEETVATLTLGAAPTIIVDDAEK